MIMYIAGNHNTHWMVRSFLSQPFGTKKAYLCHATGTEQSAQNLSATRPAMAICFCVHTRFSVTCAGFVDFGGTLWYFGGTAKVPSIGAQMLNISALKQTRFSFFQNGGMHHEVYYTGVPGTHPYRYTTTKETNINKQIVLNAYCESAPVDGTPVTTWKYTGSDSQQWAGVGNVAITACYKPTNQYYSGNVISSDANPDVAINIYRSSTNSMPEVNLKNLIGNKFADVVITRNGTSYSVGPRAGIGTRYLQRTSSISNSGGGQYMRWGTTPSPFYAYDVPYNVFT